MSDEVEFRLCDPDELRQTGLDLILDNYDEMGESNWGFQLKINWEVFDAGYAMDKLFIMTAWGSGVILGYNVVWLVDHPHFCGQKVAQSSVLYVRGEERRRGVGLRLIRASEREAKSRGAEVMLWSAKIDTRAFQLMTRMGYQPIETLFARDLYGAVTRPVRRRD